MLAAASTRFANDPGVIIREHDLDNPLPDDQRFDVIVSSFAIHHCTNARKRTLYAEIHDRLTPGGTFCNLEHVASPTASLHARFLTNMGASPGNEDPSNILLDVIVPLNVHKPVRSVAARVTYTAV